ncbi:immunoglobulin-like domain-containing protein [Cohnella thailandensis]|uniref:DUF5011 domain-containing protein n=1 Tax=Cohnella thailandensis TaxID=557557 RepID=A0A841T485_9BACL|nr:immunoglobulin-like domain-containing protein [Cohnella thailandensis]MBB6637646.1 DUF5011 domain-containing protein [Cohnella thailandensis]MBP1974178.1 hypothetical protein [Cohnella thailandensis]
MDGLRFDLSKKLNLSFRLFLAITLALACFVPFASPRAVSAAGGLDEGAGSEEDPYLIRSAEQLYEVSVSQSVYLNSRFRLAADIDFTGWDWSLRPWTPIGSDAAPFTGDFDGAGHVVIGLAINEPSLAYAGMFGYNDGTIRRLGLQDVHVSGNSYTGALTGYNTGTIHEAFSAGSVAGLNLVGGLVGLNTGGGIVRYSHSSADVSGNEAVGGLVGYNSDNSKILFSYATGDASGSARVGGLVGLSNGTGALIQHAYATGDADGTVWDVGGIAGFIGPGSTTQFVFATGSVAGVPADKMGGLVGYSASGSLYYGFWLTDGTTVGAFGSNYGFAGALSGHTLSELQQEQTFAGWGPSFTDNWWLPDDGSLPQLASSIQLTNVSSSVYLSNARSLTLTGQASSVDEDDLKDGLGLHIRVTDADTAPVTDLSRPTLILDGSGEWQTTIDYSELPQPIADGDYALSVWGVGPDRNTALKQTTIRIDTEDPVIEFDADGQATPARTAESTVTATDTGSSVASLVYAWTQSADVPASGWTPFASGDVVKQTAGDGEWYLHVRAQDEAGNIADAVSNAFVLDNTPPVLVLNGSNPMSIPQGGTYAEPGATATDAIDGGLPSSSIGISGTVDPERIGEYAIRYEVADLAGNEAAATRTVRVYDGDAPAIYLNGESLITVEANSPFVDPGATALDVQDGDLTSSIAVTGTVNTAVPGTYSLAYDVTDSAGNAAETVTRTVKVTPQPIAASPSPVVPRLYIDKNGILIDPAAIDAAKPSVTLEATPKDDSIYVSVPASVLSEFANRNADFLIEIKSPYGSYRMPVDLASRIPGLTDLLTENGLESGDIRFKLTMTDKSGDKDIQEALAASLPNGKAISPIVEYRMEIIDIRTGRTIGTADSFGKALEGMIPVTEQMTDMPDQWGAFRYNETNGTFEFVPARAVKSGDAWVAAFRSYTDGIFAAVRNPVSFSDLRNGWSEPYIRLAAAKDLVDGIGGGQYAPDKSVTRAEFAAMLVRMLGRGASAGGAAPYDDVKQDAWYFDEVVEAKVLGLLDFAKGNRFLPGQPLTREEMAGMLASVMALEELPMTKEYVSLDGYEDIGDVSAGYLEDVRLMVKLKIMTGVSEAEFRPQGETTRAQAAAVFIRALRTLGMID